MTKGHNCDNCDKHLDSEDFEKYGSWDYTCSNCGFKYVHGYNLQEQLNNFLSKEIE